MAKSEFETGFRERKPAYVLFARRGKGPGVRDVPECIHLPPEPGVTPSTRPPVRIYLGTEPAQYRPERIFVWSVLKQRDPARAYEIHLMKEVSGFERGDWKTGFSRYRFAIPHWAGRQGRAIYNDVDQIYLRDPAELFDMDMGGNAVLTITRRETSVMLLDCEKLGPLWTLEDARVKHKKHFRAVTEDVWGDLDPAWNARDSEYVPGESKLLHFTTLHTQPWRPFPGVLRYRDNRDAEVWFELERSADAAGFTSFTRARPSAGFPPKSTAPGGVRPARKALDELILATGARSLLSVGCAGVTPAQLDLGAEIRSTAADVAEPPAGPAAGVDGVLALGTLEYLADEDVPWVLNELFERARRFVFVQVSERPGRPDLRHTVNRPEWWREELERTARRFPDLRWALVARRSSWLGTRTRCYEQPARR